MRYLAIVVVLVGCGPAMGGELPDGSPGGDGGVAERERCADCQIEDRDGYSVCRGRVAHSDCPFECDVFCARDTERGPTTDLVEHVCVGAGCFCEDPARARGCWR